MIPAYSPVPPLTFGYDPEFSQRGAGLRRGACQGAARYVRLLDRTEMVAREPGRLAARARLASQADSLSRQYNELWKKSTDAIASA